MNRIDEVMAKVEEYGEALLAAELCDNYGKFGAAKRQKDDAARLLSELRALVGEMERDAARYRWLRGEVEGPHVPMAQVVWKLNWNREGSKWTNLADGAMLDQHCDEAIAKQEGS